MTFLRCTALPLLLSAFALAPAPASAQQTPFILEQSEGSIYLRHRVVAKENWYSIGRMYNVPPRELADSNHLTLEKVLDIGETLRIPMVRSNFVQSGQPREDESYIPLYHIVRPKEGIFRISQDYRKVPLAQLRMWNGLEGDALQMGRRLQVGFLRVRKDQSSLAVFGQQGEVVAPVVRKEPDTAVQREAVVKPPQPDTDSARQSDKGRPAVAETGKPSAQPRDTAVKPVQPSAGQTSGGGFFRDLFLEQEKAGSLRHLQGQAAPFKSTSGWKDAKYYAMMDNVTPGTVVRITDPGSGRSIFAKVLGAIPEMQENAGLAIRLSSAGMAELGLGDSRYPVQLSWSLQ